MSLAEDTRRAVRERPWLLTALQAGVVNYAAAARALDVDADAEAVATALRRFEDRLPSLVTDPRDCRVTMARDVEEAGHLAAALVDSDAPDRDRSDLAAVLVTGAVDSTLVEHCLGCLQAAGVEPVAVAAAGDRVVLLVPQRTGPDAIRTVEAALATVPG